MPPSDRKVYKNQKSFLRDLAKMAEKAGVNPEALLSGLPISEIGPEAEARRQREAESVLFYVKTEGRDWQDGECSNCELPFLKTYEAVEYCSDLCRADALEQLGIMWNPDRKLDIERWNGKIPKVIGVEATQALKDSGNYVE